MRVVLVDIARADARRRRRAPCAGRTHVKRALLLLSMLVATAARAHDLRPGVLSFVEHEPGELGIRFVPPIDSRGEAIDLALVLPDGCTRNANRVRCANGFGGELAVGG